VASAMSESGVASSGVQGLLTRGPCILVLNGYRVVRLGPTTSAYLASMGSSSPKWAASWLWSLTKLMLLSRFVHWGGLIHIDRCETV
jgi:hypothetical protein